MAINLQILLIIEYVLVMYNKYPRIMVIIVAIISFLHVYFSIIFWLYIFGNLIIHQFLNLFVELLVLPKVQFWILLRRQSPQSFIFDLNQILVCLPIKKIDVGENLLKSYRFIIKIFLLDKNLLLVFSIHLTVCKLRGIFILVYKSVCLVY